MKTTDIITNEEIIDEWSNTDKGINAELKRQGYKFLGSGVDQSAYLEPGTGYVLKVFGTQPELKGKPNKFSADHKMFFTWAKFCMANPDNPYLPKFFGYESFVFNNHNYLQIRQERLTKSGDLGDSIESIADYLAYSTINELFTTRAVSYEIDALMAVLGSKEEVARFGKTIKALQKIGNKKGWDWDLHGGNVMKRGKIPVIVDPWVV